MIICFSGAFVTSPAAKKPGTSVSQELFTGTSTAYSSFGKTGITETRSALMSEYTSQVPTEYNTLKQTYRISAGRKLMSSAIWLAMNWFFVTDEISRPTPRATSM